ncbi:hypothetical protein BH23ACT12_BH23ACT12_02390 [soil metagenome]
MNLMREAQLARLLVVSVVLAALIAAALPVAAAPPQGDNKWALIIGVDDHIGRTRDNIGAVGDSAAFRELVRRDGFRDDRVRVLTDGAATAAGIRAGMQWLVDNCDENSYCLFHFSGHTKQMNGGDSTGGLHEYLWSSDNRFISDDEFAGFMTRLRGFAWVDLANCESAGFDHGISSPRRLFTGASQEHEKGFENPAWSQSIWTGSLVQRAMLEGNGDQNGDGHVTLREALPYAAEVSARLTAGQSPSPQHPYIKGGEETDWFPAPGAAAAVRPRNCLLGIICL